MFKLLLTVFCIIVVGYLAATLPKLLKTGRQHLVRLSMFLFVVIIMILIIIKIVA